MKLKSVFIISLLLLVIALGSTISASDVNDTNTVSTVENSQYPEITSVNNEILTDDNTENINTENKKASEITGSIDENSNNIIINLRDKENNTPIANAELKYILNNDPEKNISTNNDGNAIITAVTGENNLNVKFEGNDIYNGTEYTNTVVISNQANKRTSTNIVSSNMVQTAVDFYNGERGGYFNVTLTDSNGNPLEGKQIYIGFNGVEYHRTTDKNGFAQLQINLRSAGTYTFATAFLGDDEYNGIFVVNSIKVTKKATTLTVPNKSFKVNAKTKTITVNLKGTKAVNNKETVDGKNRTVKVTVNGKTYTAKTNSNGVATVKVNINKKGTYTVTTKFTGDGTYNSKTTKSKLYIR